MVESKKFRVGFFTLGTSLAFVNLKQAFINILIQDYFELECYIQIEINISGYTISEISSQLTLNNSS